MATFDFNEEEEVAFALALRDAERKGLLRESAAVPLPRVTADGAPTLVSHCGATSKARSAHAKLRSPFIANKENVGDGDALARATASPSTAASARSACHVALTSDAAAAAPANAVGARPASPKARAKAIADCMHLLQRPVNEIDREIALTHRLNRVR